MAHGVIGNTADFGSVIGGSSPPGPTQIMSSPIKIFSGTNSRQLAEKISDFFGSPLGEIELLKFSDGEMQVYYQESIRGSDVYLIQSTFSPTPTIWSVS